VLLPINFHYYFEEVFIADSARHVLSSYYEILDWETIFQQSRTNDASGNPEKRWESLLGTPISTLADGV
jgi:hypothetical protein